MNIRTYSRKIVLSFIMILLLATAVNLVTAAPYQADSATAVVKTGSLNVRYGPSVAYSVITSLQWGDSVTLLGRNSDSSWAKIRLADNSNGWVSTAYITPSTPISGLPDMTPAAAPRPKTYAYINEGMLNIRSGPGVEFPAIATIGYNSYVQVLGRDARTSWVKVLTQTGHEGWLNSIYTTMSVKLENLPIVSAAPSPTKTAQPAPTVQPMEPKPLSNITAVISTGMLNMRSGPSTAHDVIRHLPHNQIVSVLGRASRFNAWVKVRTNSGSIGWINASFTEMNAELDALPILESSASPYGSVTVISNGSNLRAGAGTNYAIITGVPYGSVLDLFGQNEDGSWYKVKTANGTDGWVYAAHVK